MSERIYRKSVSVKQKSVMALLKEACSDICDSKCKMPELYEKRYADAEEAQEKLLEEQCAKCKMTLLF